MKITQSKALYHIKLFLVAVMLLANFGTVDVSANARGRNTRAASLPRGKSQSSNAISSTQETIEGSDEFAYCRNNSIITIQSIEPSYTNIDAGIRPVKGNYLNVDPKTGVVNVDGTGDLPSGQFKVIRSGDGGNDISFQSVSNGRKIQARDEGDWTVDTADLSSKTGPLFSVEEELLPVAYGVARTYIKSRYYHIKSLNTQGYLNVRKVNKQNYLRTHGDNNLKQGLKDDNDKKKTRFLIKIIDYAGDSIDECTNGSIIAIQNDASGKYLNVDAAGKVNLDGTDCNAKSSQFKVIRSGNSFKLQSELNGRFVQARDKGDWTVDTAQLDSPNGPQFSFERYNDSSNTIDTLYCIKSVNTGGCLNWRGGANLRTHGGDWDPDTKTEAKPQTPPHPGSSEAASQLNRNTKFFIQIISKAAPGPTEVLSTLPTEGQKVAIKNIGSGKYLQVGGYSDEPDNKDWLYSWGTDINKQEAQFIIDVRNPDAMNPNAPLNKCFGFRSVANGKYVEAVPQGGNPGFVIRTNRQDFGTNIWDSFTIEQNENDTTGKTFRIKSNAENGGYLNWRGRGHLRTHGDDAKTATTENTIPNNILFTFEVIR